MGDKMPTNYAKAKYTELIDLETINGLTNIIGIHTPVGQKPYQKLRGFFTQFRKYRYKGCRITMVPAANLPIDPLGLTGVPGTTDLMDPRDVLNPILFHGAHGENLSIALNNIYNSSFSITTGTGEAVALPAVVNSGSLDESTSDSLGQIKVPTTGSFIEQVYYQCLSDPKWRKFGSQSQIRINGLHPLTWRMSTSMPILPTYGTNVSTQENGNLYKGQFSDTHNRNVQVGNGNTAGWTSEINEPGVTAYTVGNLDGTAVIGTQTIPNQVMTTGVSRLGWLPTWSMRYGASTASITMLPKLYMGILILPPAYNIQQYYRASITHYFEFAGFTSSLGGMDPMAVAPTPSYINTSTYFNWIDYGDARMSDTETDGSIKLTNGNAVDITGTVSEISDGVV